MLVPSCQIDGFPSFEKLSLSDVDQLSVLGDNAVSGSYVHAYDVIIIAVS